MEQDLKKLLDNIFAWAEHVQKNAARLGSDGLVDDGMIIQELIEDYLDDKGINPRDVLNYDKWVGKGAKARYDSKYNS